MKNTILIVLIVMAMLFAAVGCGNKEDATPSNPQEPNDKVEAVADGTEEATPQEEGAEQEEDKEIDKNLTGLDLLKSITYKAPKTLMMVSEVSMATGGGDIVTTTYQKGEFLRMEYDMMGQKSVVIYHADENATYQYIEGASDGVKMPDSDGEEAMVDMSLDISVPDMQSLADTWGTDAVARVEQLDGHEVIYVETSISEDGMLMGIKMWYSAEYGFPLQYEIIMGDTVFMTQKVIQIEVDKKIDDNLFVPPSDITFAEFSVDSLFGE